MLVIALSQGVALILLLTVLWALPEALGGGLSFQSVALLLAVGVVAASIGRLLGLKGAWLILQALLPLAAAVALLTLVPSWVYLAIFTVLLLVYWNAFLGRVPLYLTNPRTRRAIAELIPPDAKSAADLGCGLGGVVLHLARERPDLRVIGIESAPIPFVISWLRLKLASLPNVEIRCRSFWRCDLGEFGAVYCFLSPVPMAALFEKARREMPSGGLLISNSFVVPGLEPDETRDVGDRRATMLSIWRMPDDADRG